jgi:hypothetical protein
MHDCGHTGINLSHGSSNKRFKVMFGCHTRKTFVIFTKKNSYTWNSIRNTESIAV